MAKVNIEATHNKPELDIKAARAVCDKIQAEFLNFNDDLEIIFILSGIQDSNTALVEKQSNILELPQGQELFNLLKKQLESTSSNSKVVGVVSQEQKTLMGFKTKHQHTAIINIDASECEDEQSLKMVLFNTTWKALSLISDIENNNDSALNKQNQVSTTKWNNAEETSRNMFADIFSGSLAELNGQKGALRSLAKKRALDCFENLAKYDAKSNPYPIMLETAQMIFDDFNETKTSQKNNITTALNIVTEAIETSDENLITQWQSFIETAREMAWADLPISQILGAAIYTSDNVYNRNSAYIIAEILNTDPAPVIEFDGYNAFADIESQQRNHKIACLETFEYVQGRQIEELNPKSYFKMADQSCQMLLEGKPNGFCAPALVAAGKAISENADSSKEELSKIFTSQINSLPWIAIRDLHKTIIDLRKANKVNGLKSIIEILRQDEEARNAAILIKELSDMNA